ncbi:hypothetical protein [Flagellimonas halotolerans]|uniref:Uncharacterized protein n=1 Tax=Flagellimonas halotolerans TaxID=3112164 RepID=A0ABU6IPS2_9FLAO|nr:MULTISPECIES: hypothetical protein [unclassified Allomuricauda]MEC3965084.1 hypothetical protein [Muricauda sp. SYSU M86414]MEC4265071.1 hypothetical protein [Muricauda sp. SYSU M84420]
MMFHFILLPLILFQISNPKFDNNVTNPELCKKLQEMAIADQKYRGSDQNIKDVYPLVLDSLIKAKDYTQQTFDLLPEHEQGKIKRLSFKLLSHHIKPKMAENKSLAKKQEKIDAANTEELIKIVKENGWVTRRSLGCDQKFRTAIIFRHAPKKYWKQARELIEKEIKAKRISEYEYYVIDNHLKGRPPLTRKRSDFPNQSWFLNSSG